MKTRTTVMKFLLDVAIVIVLAIIFSFAFKNFQGPAASSNKSNALLDYPPPEPPLAPMTSPEISFPTLTETPTKETPTPTASPTPGIDENGWYIYSDADAGFSFSYPPDLVGHVSAGYKSVEISFRLLGVGGHEGMSIQKYPNPDEKTVEEIARIIYEETSQRTAPSDFNSITKPELVEIAGYRATKMIIPSFISEFLLFIDNGKFTLIIGPVHDAVLLYSAPKALDLFYKILSTLKLTSITEFP